MLVPLHVFIALLGIVSYSYAFCSPSQPKINCSYGLLAGTLLSGSLLVWQTHQPLLPACISGLVYTGFLLSLLTVASHKLAKETI